MATHTIVAIPLAKFYFSGAERAMDDDPGFGFKGDIRPQAFVEWKGTDVCMDFYCDCGAHCHFDGYFAYAVKCPHCEAEWEMPWNLYPRRFDRTSKTGKLHDPMLMEPDEEDQG